MKIGDLVLYAPPHDEQWEARLGIITSFDLDFDERVWVHWLESGDEQWAPQLHLEILSENR